VITLPRAIEQAIREHAEAQPDGWEAAGRVLVRGYDFRVVRYEPVSNRATSPGRARFALATPAIADGHIWIGCHSHPATANTNILSSGDVRAALARGWPLVGLWAIDTLSIWRVISDRDQRTIPIRIEA
jgi:hypothetical protein